MARIVDRVKAAGGIERFVLEECKEIIRLAPQPATVAFVFTPWRRFDGQTSHCLNNLPIRPALDAQQD
jgi:hypothetical protein